MEFFVKPYKHQLEALERSREQNNLALLWDMGCISGKELIRINRGGCCRVMTMKEAFTKFHSSWDLTIETKCRSLVGTTIGLHTIVNILFSGIKDTIRITLADGKTLELTEDHEVMTDIGFIKAKDLLGKSVMIDSPIPNKLPVKKKKDRDTTCNVGMYHPFARKVKRSDRNSYRYIIEKHRRIYESHINNLTEKDFIEKTHDRIQAVKLKFIDTKNMCIHHKDMDHYNNNIENLEVISKEEHARLHSPNNKNNFNQGVPRFSKCIGIEECGKQEVFDIVCRDPHRNFVVNDIVVHNCGKTGALILILRDKYNTEKRIMRTLILGPTGVLYNWHNEIQKFSRIPNDRIAVLTAKERKKQHNEPIQIVNYEALINTDFRKSMVDFAPEIIICDESHMLANPMATRSKAVFEISKKAQYRFILTGTPTSKNMMNLFQQYLILDQGVTLGKNYFVFRGSYFYDRNAAFNRSPHYFPKWEPIPELYPKLLERVHKVSLRVDKKDCLDLPPRIEVDKFITLTKGQEPIYKALRDEFVAYLEQKNEDGSPKAVVAQLAVTKMIRLRQLLSGFVTTDTGEIVTIANNPRLVALQEILEEIGEKNKVIIWCVFKEEYKLISELLKEMGRKHVFLNGSMTAEEKQLAIDDFNNNPETTAIIANRKAGGTGINLTAASYSIDYSKTYSLIEYLQAKDRNYRGGSEQHDEIVNITITTKGTIDEDVALNLKGKKEISDLILNFRKESK